MKLPHSVVDRLVGTLDLAEQSVYLQLLRLSWGFQRTTCKAGYDALERRCNISRNTVKKAIQGLERRGLIRKIGKDNEAGNNRDRGTIYEVALEAGGAARTAGGLEIGAIPDSGTVPEIDPMKEHVKETGKTPPPASSFGGGGEQLALDITQRYGLTPARAQNLLSALSIEDLALVPRLLEHLDEQIARKSVQNPAGLLSTWLADFDQWRPQLVKPRAVERPAPANPPVGSDDEEGKWIARQVATRFYEHNRHEPAYSRERLRSDVEVALEGQGRRVSDEDLDWAIEPFHHAG